MGGIVSAVTGRSRMDVLVESQHRRQRILDYLHANGAASVLQITTGISDVHKLVTGTLALMRARHEVAATGKRMDVRYIALATTTVSAQEMHDAIRDHAAKRSKTAATEVAEASKRAKHEPWRTVHKGGENPAIKNQGGQGSLRRTVYVNCQQNY